MPGQVDDILKQLTEFSPEEWVVQAGRPRAPATVIDADIATISGATDKVIRVTGPPDWLLAVDFQAGHDTVEKLPDYLLYNSALFRRHRLRVINLIVLLHKGADSPQLTGYYQRAYEGEPFDAALRYRVLRIWELPVEKQLSGGLGLLPLAALGNVRPEELPGVITRMKRRLDSRIPPNRAAELWSATLILMGLRYDREMIQRLLQGVITMKESVTYQAILEEGEAIGIAKGEAKGRAEGKAEEARRMLLLLGVEQFGVPSANVQEALDALTKVKRIEELTLQVKHAASWEELLGISSRRRGSTRRKLP